MSSCVVSLASTHQTENLRGFSEVGENKRLFIVIVVRWLFYISIISSLLFRLDLGINSKLSWYWS